MEMRRESRYRLDAPVLFSRQNEQQHQIHGEGITRDISVLGVFTVTPRCPPLDVPVQVDGVLPSLTGIKAIIRVSGPALVQRVEHHSEASGESGFAIVSEDFYRDARIALS